MDRNELHKHLSEMDAKFEKAKEKRILKTLFAYSVVFFLLFCYLERPSGLDFVGYAFISVLVAGVHIIVNLPVFGYLALQGDAERKYLEAIKKKLYPDQEDI